MPHKFIISGGGTGGHIFPAVAIAKSLQQKYPDCEILFIGANNRMEMEKVPQEGYKIIGLDVAGLKRSLSLANFSVAFKFVKSYFKAKKILQDFNPDCVIGTGGYASLAVLYAAGKNQYKSLIWEGNGYAGLTNKILAKRVNTICTGFSGMEQFFPKEKIVFTGNPVRNEILNIPSKSDGLNKFHLSPDKPVIFITGGSLGARTINNCIQAGLHKFSEQNIQLIWQTGKNFDPVVHDPNSVKAMSFLREMNYAYAAADLVISRAGALSVSEIAVADKASVLVPSPNVTEDHQTKNALKLTEKNAALLISDADAAENLVNEALALVQNNTRMEEMRINLKPLAKPDATESITLEIEKLITK